MPVQINEIIVRANIVEKPPKQANAADSSKGGSADNDEVVKECVEKVLEILKSKIER